jgi:hypothetical protein
MYLKDGVYVKRIMEWSLDDNNWHFSQRSQNGVELFDTVLPNFCQEFQQYIDDGSIISGWYSGKNFTLAGSACHVSASKLHFIIPPGSVVKALHKNNLDKDIWAVSYKKEYDGLIFNHTFDIISEEEYQKLKRSHGVRVIPSMCTFVVKHTNSIPTRAKSRIVVLGNLEQHSWTKANCFCPVISVPMIQFLTALAVQNGRTLKQADCKFALIQASLPPDEHTIVKPPIGCPFSNSGQYWRFKKTLHGLRHAPRHWHNKIRSVLESPELG